MVRAALNVFALTGSTIVLTYGAAIRASEISWKIDEPTAQRLAAEAHYGQTNTWMLLIMAAT
jgi:hypothetical protein